MIVMRGETPVGRVF